MNNVEQLRDFGGDVVGMTLTDSEEAGMQN